MADNPEHATDLTPIGKRRRDQQASRACDRCKRCRSRCKGATPGEQPGPSNPCQRCSESGAPCTWEVPQKRRGPSAKKTHALSEDAVVQAALRQALERGTLQDLIDQIAPGATDSPDLGGSVASSIPSTSALRRQPDSFLRGSPISSSTSPPTSHSPRSAPRVFLDPTGAPVIAGPSSGVHLVAPSSWSWPPFEGPKVTGTAKDDRGWPRYARPAREDILPSPVEVEQLMEVYWQHAHPFCPVLYMTTFGRRLNDLLNIRLRHQAFPSTTGGPTWADVTSDSAGRNFLITVLAALSLASIFGSSIEPSHEQRLATSEEFFESAMQLLSVDPFHRAVKADDRNMRATALLLLSQREFGCSNVHSAWNLLSSAVHLAQSNNVCRDPTLWAITARTTHEVCEEAKRLWAGLVIMDLLICALIGVPSMISSDDYDTPLPSADEPDEVAQWRPLSRTSAAVPTYLSMKTRSLSCANALTALSVICADFLCVFSSPKDRRTGEEGLERHIATMQRLQEWRAALPSHLVIDFDAVNAGSGDTVMAHVIELMLEYEAAVILCWRPLLKDEFTNARVYQDRNISPRLLCSTAAANSNGLVRLYANIFDLRFSSYRLVFHLLSAAFVHLFECMHADGGESAPTAAQRNYAETFDFFSTLKETWPAATSSLTFLSSVSRLHQPQGSHSSRAASVVVSHNPPTFPEEFEAQLPAQLPLDMLDENWSEILGQYDLFNLFSEPFPLFS